MLLGNFEERCLETRSLPVRQRVFCCLTGLDTGVNTNSTLALVALQ